MNGRRRCVGVILAGGASSRMGGQPKGLLRVGGARIIDRLAAMLVDVTARVVISANDVAAAEWLPGVACVGDETPGLGPLSGIQAALRATGTDILVMAWDMALLQPGVVRDVRREAETTDALIVAPRSNSPWGFEPLCAWYAAESLPVIDAQLKAGDSRPGALVGRAKVQTVDVSSWGNPDDLFLSVNTPADLKRAELLMARAETT